MKVSLVQSLKYKYSIEYGHIVNEKMEVRGLNDADQSSNHKTTTVNETISI